VQSPAEWAEPELHSGVQWLHDVQEALRAASRALSAPADGSGLISQGLLVP